MSTIYDRSVTMIRDAISTIPAIRNKAIYLYDTDEFPEKSPKSPSVSIIYGGMTVNPGCNKNKTATTLVYNILVSVDKQCGKVRPDKDKIQAGEILSAIKTAMYDASCKCQPKMPCFQFTRETIFNLECDNKLGYLMTFIARNVNIEDDI